MWKRFSAWAEKHKWWLVAGAAGLGLLLAYLFLRSRSAAAPAPAASDLGSSLAPPAGSDTGGGQVDSGAAVSGTGSDALTALKSQIESELGTMSNQNTTAQQSLGKELDAVTAQLQTLATQEASDAKAAQAASAAAATATQTAAAVQGGLNTALTGIRSTLSTLGRPAGGPAPAPAPGPSLAGTPAGAVAAVLSPVERAAVFGGAPTNAALTATQIGAIQQAETTPTSKPAPLAPWQTLYLKTAGRSGVPAVPHVLGDG